MDIKTYQTPFGPRYGKEADIRDMADWAPTITQMREAVFAFHVVGASGMFEGKVAADSLRLAPTQDEVENISEQCIVAVRTGRVIDFGNLPNAVIMQTANRAGPLYTHGALAMPFRDPWIMYHTWEGGVSIYLINLVDEDKPAGGDCEIVELSPLTMNHTEHLLMIGDRALLTPDAAEEPIGQKEKYHCVALPSLWRLLPGADTMVNNTMPPAMAAASNVLDPLMTALMILHTRGIERQTIAPSPKLARARVKNRKPPIPPFDVVNSAPYVTAILARRQQRGEPLGGHHASPTPHLRMGHPRHYPSGVVRLIPDALVNMTEEMKASFRSNRSHYSAKT